MRNLFSLLLVNLFFLEVSQAEVVHPPIEKYGELPILREFSISPDGSKFAFLKAENGREVLVVSSMDGAKVSAINTSDVKTRSIDFLDDEYALISASETTKMYGFRGKLEYSATFAFNSNTEKIVQLLKREKTLFPAQSGLGKIVGVLENENRVLMPGYVGDRYNQNPPYNLFSVDPKKGYAKRFARGNGNTIDWFVNKEGVILAREDHNDNSSKYKIATKRTGKWETVYEIEDSQLLPFSLMGVKADESSLIVIDGAPNSGGDAVYELDWDGKFSKPLYVKEGADIDSVVLDKNRKVYGVKYSGMRPSYKFFDEILDKNVQKLFETYPQFAINILSWNSDWSLLVVKISGGKEAGNYYLFEPETQGLIQLGKSRDIPEQAIGDIETIEYKARDGTAIPSLITWPANEDRTLLPTIIMPHGGPASYDQVQFDWMAQYFANRGYLVLQPNFRGSEGFGWNHLRQGRKQWGGLMQDDVTDGVKALIDGGYADPDKICIVGASYGGFSALSGGATTPDLYRCVAAIAPVTDLPRFLEYNKEEYGKNGRGYVYWTRNIGDPKTDKQKLKQTSPVNQAESFNAPVLLIHGKDDTVVHIRQSEVMRKVLKKAGKDVEFIKLKGEDHWLSTSETRLDTLRALDAFIREHNPVN